MKTFSFRVHNLVTLTKSHTAVVEGEVLTGRVEVGDVLREIHDLDNLQLKVRSVPPGSPQISGRLVLAFSERNADKVSSLLQSGKTLHLIPHQP